MTMSTPASVGRQIAIHVLDRNGHPLSGALVEFALNGQPCGSVISSAGVASIETPSPTDRVDVTVSYEKTQISTDLTGDETEHTFKLDVSPPLYKAFIQPRARCPDGTEGQPCVICKVGDKAVRICA